MENEYVLREKDNDEIKRLQFQHQIWKEETNLAITRAKVFDGETVIDLGSGPGYLSYELLELIGENGKIYCIDNSDLFINYISNQKYTNITPVKLDIRNELSTHHSLPQNIDKIFCRWVLMFTGSVDKIITDAYNLLKPGGKFISMEYFNFKHISMFPQSESFNKLFNNVWKLIKQNNGNADAGNQVCNVMQETGFKKIELFPVYKTGKVNSLTWKWLEQTNQNHGNLVDAGLITKDELDAFYTEWQQISKNELAFITAPPLMITIGEK